MAIYANGSLHKSSRRAQPSPMARHKTRFKPRSRHVHNPLQMSTRTTSLSLPSSSSSPMMVTTRSRTLLFYSFRDSNARPRRTRQRILSTYGPREDDMDEESQGLLPPATPPRPTPTSPHDHPLPPKWSVLSLLIIDRSIWVTGVSGSTSPAR